MSSCAIIDVQKFVISKYLDNTFVFTIKEDNASTPMPIDPADTFTAKLRLLSDGSEVLSKDMTIEDASNGRVKLTITAAETENLELLVGDSEDRYYPKPVYSLVLVCNTLVNGSFLAKVPYVYVD